MKKSADPFSKFVNSIISEKPKQKPFKIEEKSAPAEMTGDGGDLALILAASSTQEPTKNQDSRSFNTGLGYAPSKADLETAT